MNETVAYLLNGAIWAAFYLTVGYLLGRADHLLKRLFGMVVHIESEVHDLKLKSEGARRDPADRDRSG